MSAKEFWSNVTESIKKNDTKIMTGIGVAGMVGAVVATGFATVKAVRAVDAEKERQGVDKLDFKSTFKVTWKYYLGPVAMVIGSGTSIICSDIKDNTIKAGLASTLAFNESWIKEYKEEVINKIGEKKEEEIHHKVLEKRIEKAEPPADPRNCIVVGGEDVWCVEPMSNHTFKTGYNTIKAIVNDANYQMTYGNEPYLSYGEFMSNFGVNLGEYGESIGWSAEEKIDIAFDPSFNVNGMPAITFRYTIPPHSNYKKLH